MRAKCNRGEELIATLELCSETNNHAVHLRKQQLHVSSAYVVSLPDQYGSSTELRPSKKKS